MTAHVKWVAKPKLGFHLQPMSQAKRQKPEENGRLSHILLSMASDERIREATPSLRSLYEFLARPKP